ncbi:metallophosphoesterase [Oscillochloris sp. ZM17-4]|uniref:metallophosphoesterase n=1 Tax=Oscillochloris sp. ZM17-4 TaxID=2866714 RepID=UPI001C7374EC|nr:metallophosphoesterase [Oscillochloris sp. ZM17-4]MBX0329766.1 metallophosphoesterase [Oscillochloris sp. ZM17-4]
MASTTHKAGDKDAKRPDNPFAPLPGRVRYSARWLGASAGATALAALAVARGGPRAAAAIGAAGVAGATYATSYEPSRPRMERISLRFPGLPPALDGLRIGQLSDLHLGHRFAIENTRWAVAQMVDEGPDLLALTGDLVSYTRNIAELPGLLAPLRAPLGIYAVPGNHDHWEGMPAIAAALRPLGVEFLVNARRSLRWRGAEFTLAGVDDAWDGEMDMAAALEGAPAGGFTVLLCHMPDMADEAAQRGVDLQLSGHTHGGHMRLPWLGSFVLPRHGWRYPIGLHHVGRTQVYVSRGIGPCPLSPVPCPLSPRRTP